MFEFDPRKRTLLLKTLPAAAVGGIGLATGISPGTVYGEQTIQEHVGNHEKLENAGLSYWIPLYNLHEALSYKCGSPVDFMPSVFNRLYAVVEDFADEDMINELQEGWGTRMSEMRLDAEAMFPKTSAGGEEEIIIDTSELTSQRDRENFTQTVADIFNAFPFLALTSAKLIRGLQDVEDACSGRAKACTDGYSTKIQWNEGVYYYESGTNSFIHELSHNAESRYLYNREYLQKQAFIQYCESTILAILDLFNQVASLDLQNDDDASALEALSWAFPIASTYDLSESLLEQVGTLITSHYKGILPSDKRPRDLHLHYLSIAQSLLENSDELTGDEVELIHAFLYSEARYIAHTFHSPVLDPYTSDMSILESIYYNHRIAIQGKKMSLWTGGAIPVTSSISQIREILPPQPGAWSRIYLQRFATYRDIGLVSEYKILGSDNIQYNVYLSDQSQTSNQYVFVHSQEQENGYHFTLGKQLGKTNRDQGDNELLLSFKDGIGSTYSIYIDTDGKPLAFDQSSNEYEVYELGNQPPEQVNLDERHIVYGRPRKTDATFEDDLEPLIYDESNDTMFRFLGEEFPEIQFISDGARIPSKNPEGQDIIIFKVEVPDDSDVLWSQPIVMTEEEPRMHDLNLKEILDQFQGDFGEKEIIITLGDESLLAVFSQEQINLINKFVNNPKKHEKYDPQFSYIRTPFGYDGVSDLLIPAFTIRITNLYTGVIMKKLKTPLFISE